LNKEIRIYKNYIDGKWVEPSTGNYYTVYNPANKGEKIGKFPLSGKNDVEEAIKSANCAFQEWRRMLPTKKTEYIYNLIAVLEKKKENLAKVICKEEGKTFSEAMGEVNRCPSEMHFVAGETFRLEGSNLPSERMWIQNNVIRIPIGVIAAINPWNFPLMTPIRKIIPALAAGCTVVFKPAFQTPLTAVILTESIEEAGFPSGTVNLVMGQGSEIGDVLVGHPLVKGVSFTGSTEVGRKINLVAAHNFTKVQLEMGGSNPLIVADYSNLKEAASQIIKGTYSISGQRCTAIRRAIVLEKHADMLENYVIDGAKQLKVGNGMDNSTQIGPLINQSAVNTMLKYIESAKKEGATIALGGRQLKGGIYDKGYYFEPTIITNVTPEMKVAKEEIFGPILLMIRVNSFEEAITVSNNTEYGLSASLFTDRMDYIFDYMENLEAGQLHINHQTVTDTHLPFGGLKYSGYGPFSKGNTNQDFYTNRKTIYIKYK
jgi:aldehyde dehydrogenase (NAD+)